MSVDEEFSVVYSQYCPQNDEDKDDSDDDVRSHGDDEEVYLSHAEGDMEQSFVTMDLSAVDEEEQVLIINYLSKDCCNNKCQTIIPRKMIENTRNNCLALSKIN